MVCLLSCSNSNDCVYTVDEAYELGLIRRDELENLADYYNNRYNDSNQKHTISELKSRTLKRIKKAYYKRFFSMATSVDTIEINYYYGIYGECLAFQASDIYVKVDLMIEEEHEVDGVIFKGFCNYFLLLYYKAK